MTASQANSDTEKVLMMKKTFLIILTAALLLCSCKETNNLPEMTYESGTLVAEDGSVYNAAPAGYEPVSIGEACAYFADTDTTLYQIGTLDSSLWMTEEYFGEATTIFYSSSITLPTLAEMNPDTLYVCEATDTGSISLLTIEDKDFIDMAVEASTADGEQHIWPPTDTQLDLDLKFYSADYPAFYYNVSVACLSDGYYVYNRNSGKGCIYVGTIFDEYLKSLYIQED
jgi:hypothetical protein